MNKLILVVSTLAVLALGGCNEEKLKALETRNAELEATATRQDSVLNDFLASFNAIEDNLSVIREKESLVTVTASDPEMRKNQKDRIVGDIQSINELMEKNRQLMEDLNKKLSSSNARVAEFKKMVERLNVQIQEKDAEITTLKEALAQKDFQLGELNTQVTSLRTQTESQTATISTQQQEMEQQKGVIDQQVKEMNTVYFVTGTAKELIAKGVLDKKGKAKVKGDLPQSAFTEIDRRETFTIPVGSKKAVLGTVHPSSSYVMKEADKKVESLEITDYESFWKSSRYLVVIKD